jgi:DegV family protein with EDD domain
MSKVVIVTDSTAYLPQEIYSDLPIHVLPLQVIWGDEIFRDGVDIKPEAYYQKLQTSKISPTTSQPSPKVFQDKYQELLAQGYDILSIHISTGISGTVNSAEQAKHLLKTDHVTIIDSRITGMSLGFIVLFAARAAKNGSSLAECKAIAESMIPGAGAVFAVSSLEYLHRGGRISNASAFLGTALQLKPILWFMDGKIVAKEKIRTFSKALDRLINLMVEIVGTRKVAIGVVHADAQEAAEKVLQKTIDAIGKDRVVESIVTSVSPVVGTHTGPGTIGICYVLVD